MSYADYFGILTYICPLIYFKPESHSNWMHRELAVKRDIFLQKYINQLDAEIFQELPIFEPDILESDKDLDSPDDENDTDIEASKLVPPEYAHIPKEWIEEKYSALCIRMYDTARVHKWCIVQQYDSTPYWRVFGPREVTEIKYNENDEPISADVQWTKQLPRATAYNLHTEKLNFLDEDIDKLDKNGNALSKALFVNWGTDIDERIEGTDIEHIWSTDVYMRYIMLDITRNSARSSGFYWVKEGSQISDAMKTKVDAMFEKANTGNLIAATENVIEDMQAMYMQNPEFPVEALDKFLKLFSGACNLPLLYFNGEKEEGSIFAENTGAMGQVNDKKKAIFGKLKEYILKLVEMRWGIVCDDVFPNLEEEEEEQYKEDIIEPSSPGNGAAHKNEKVKVETR